MNWHTTPKGHAWRRVTPLSVEALGQRLWLRCNACGHDMLVSAGDWASKRSIDPTTPLLEIARRLKCTECGERNAHCWPEPHDSLKGSA